MPGNRRKRRAVSRDGTEHMESTTKNIVSRGPLIFKDEVKQGGNLRVCYYANDGLKGTVLLN